MNKPVFDSRYLPSDGSGEKPDITSIANSARILQESEARFRAALVAGHMGSWETDHTTKTRHWSVEGMALFGLDLPNGIGTVDGPNDEYVAALHPDDRHLARRFQELAARQDSFPAEYRIVRPDGTTLWLSGRGLVVERDANGRPLRLVSIMSDATERKLAEEQLRLERERLSAALSAGRMGAYDMNLQDGTLWWSPEMFALFGVDPAHFIPSPQTVISLIHPDDREAFSRLRSIAIEERQPFSHEFRLNRLDGGESWMGHRGQVEYDSNGQPVRSFGITMDITERREVDALLRDADAKKDLFIAVLAHELRNPLAPIRSANAALRSVGPMDAKALWCLDVIDRQVAQMARLLDDLLDVSRLSRGELRLRQEPIRLASVISNALEIARPLIDVGGHSLSLGEYSHELILRGDLTRLAQVFSNVLINAAKYTPEGGTIDISIVEDGKDVVVTIADSGVGIRQEDLPRIFQLFGQVNSSLNRSQGGQGIGLSLARNLVEMHGGAIEARSEGLGKGSSFEIRLPLDHQSTIFRPQAPSVSAARPDDGYRVLIADDSPDALESYAILLESMGHKVDVAGNGEQALRLAEELRPEVVLLDLGMPGMDGYEVCRRIRSTTWGKQMLLIAQTGWGGAEDLQRTHDAGFDHHLVKPVDPETVTGLFRRVVPKSGGDSTGSPASVTAAGSAP